MLGSLLWNLDLLVHPLAVRSLGLAIDLSLRHKPEPSFVAFTPANDESHDLQSPPPLTRLTTSHHHHALARAPVSHLTYTISSRSPATCVSTAECPEGESFEGHVGQSLYNYQLSSMNISQHRDFE